MSKNQSLQLISGEFTPQEAKEILMNLYNTKIKFHQVKNFSSQERLGHDDQIAIKRIADLQKQVEKLKDLLLQVQSENKNLAITSEINISFTETTE